MTRESATSTAWPLGIRIRPAVDREATTVELTDTVTGRRFQWSPEALSGLILRDRDRAEWFDRVADPDRDRLRDGWRHWQRRGWHPSDQYYVASRRGRFADADDPDGAVRTAVVRRYLAEAGPPPAELLPDGPTVELGEPARPGPRTMADLLANRRSGRSYVPRPVPRRQLSGLLWYGLAGVRKRRGVATDARPLSYLDSFGTAWDFYVCVFAVDGIAPGAYRYDVSGHRLICVRPGDHRTAMIDILQGQRPPATAAWTLGMVADFPRYQWRYRHEHGLRRLYLESGIIGQELIVLAGAYGLSCLPTPAQKDRAYLALHDLPADRYAPVYTFTMGPSRGARGFSLPGAEDGAEDGAEEPA